MGIPPPRERCRFIMRLIHSLPLACVAVSCSCDDTHTATGPRTDMVEHAQVRLTEELVRGMPWERVCAKVLRVHTLHAISVRASVRLTCPKVRVVDYYPVAKNTGLREFARLDLIEVDHLEAHHVEAGEIVADEIVATRVEAP